MLLRFVTCAAVLLALAAAESDVASPADNYQAETSQIDGNQAETSLVDETSQTEVSQAETSESTIQWDNWTKSAKLNPRVQHIPLDPTQSNLRPPPARIPDTFDMFVGSSVFRDGYRCGKTLFTALKRATHPERLHFGILEQIYEGDPTCLDEYCKMAAEEWPEDQECRHKTQITVDTRDAGESAGCTTARHQQQKLVGDQEFCLQVDGHSVFTNRWDENILADWASIDNEMAVMTMYPHHTHDYMMEENGDNAVINSIPHLCTTIRGGNGLTRIVGASMISDSFMPQMAALWGGGYSFSKCHAERKVLIDSHTPWLWDGEEFMRSANYWTYGYDLYSPSMLGNVLYHNYSEKPASFWASPMDPVKKELDTEMGANRVRLRIGMPFKGPVDTFEYEKYGFGKVRSFENYLKFANISFEGWMNDTNSCGQLHWVPYENATEVEETVGGGWKLYPDDDEEGDPEAPDVAEDWANDTKTEAEGNAEDENVPAELNEESGHHVAAAAQNAEAADDHRAAHMAVKLRHGVPSPVEKSVGTSSTSFLVVVVLAAMFVTVSSDAGSRAIRRRVCGTMPSRTHHSI
ncbi:hydroxyproline N-acetylglucosaminyltransferase [Phytophthora cinnamomi]|uniref:hydroxyproline N-acetylglucosaminyltransferase n=1 Tax=Phytophthora cinnamomi TaxID=4785 RepID=UPI00355958E8|nr:hydroxyproline N-acetylglucosaminyltransferase [Phytophthora cinnamomi]